MFEADFAIFAFPIFRGWKTGKLASLSRTKSARKCRKPIFDVFDFFDPFPEKNVTFFGVKNFWKKLLLGIPPKWKKVKIFYIYHFEREHANAHFKTFQGPFECKIEVQHHLEVKNAEK